MNSIALKCAFASLIVLFMTSPSNFADLFLPHCDQLSVQSLRLGSTYDRPFTPSRSCMTEDGAALKHVFSYTRGASPNWVVKDETLGTLESVAALFRSDLGTKLIAGQ